LGLFCIIIRKRKKKFEIKNLLAGSRKKTTIREGFIRKKGEEWPGINCKKT